MSSFIRRQTVSSAALLSPRELVADGRLPEAIDALADLDRHEFIQEAQVVAEAFGDLANAGESAHFVAVLLAYYDEQQAYAALRQAINALLALAEREKDGRWPYAIVACAELLIAYLSERPAEPLLLNHLAVCLYELNEVKPAQRLLKRALALAQDTPHAATNLKNVERRLRQPVKASFPAAVKVKLPTLVKEAEAIAARARPAIGKTISLCMIVKDEAENLPACLDSISGWVDEMIVVDTGSSDGTVEVAEARGAKVIIFPWTGSFSEARNVSLEAASGDWIIYLDGDERLSENEGEKLRALASRTWREGIYLQETNITGTEDSGGAQLHTALRFFRNRPWRRFEGAVHEQKLHTFPTELSERFEVSDVRIEHHGYLKHVRWAKGKVRRNIELIEKQVAERPSAFNLYNLGSEYSWLGDYEKARPLFESALTEVQKMGDWRNVSLFQFSPMLVVRLAESIRATDPDQLEEFVERGLAWFPQHTDLIFERALGRFARGDLQGSKSDLERCLALGDADVRWGPIAGRGSFLALVFLADIERLLGNSTAACDLLHRCLDEWPGYTPAIYNYVSLLLQSGQAAAEIEAELEARETKWTASNSMWVATAFYELRQFEQAERWYRRSLQASPQHVTSRIGLGETLLSTHRYEEAAETLEPIEKDHPLAGAALRSRIFALMLLGRNVEAKPLAELLAGITPAEGSLYLAWLAVIDGDPAPALEVAETNFGLALMEVLLSLQEWERYDTLLPLVVGSIEDERLWRRLLAELYERVGLPNLALEQWLWVCQHEPDNDALYSLARAAVMEEHYEEALAVLQVLLERDSEHLKAKLLFAQIQSHLTT